MDLDGVEAGTLRWFYASIDRYRGQFALEKGIDSLLVTLSHENDMAIAVVVALRNIERTAVDSQSGSQELSV